jgi:hypothetical protein
MYPVYGDGGGIFSISNYNNETFIVEFIEDGSTYSECASSYGGVLFCYSCTTISIKNAVFSSNYALIGAGIVADYSKAIVSSNITITIFNSTFKDNLVQWSGAFLATASASLMDFTVNITDVTVTNNIAGFYGTGSADDILIGGFIMISANSIDMTVNGGTFTNNSAVQGGIFNIQTNETSTITLNDLTVTMASCYSTGTVKLGSVLYFSGYENSDIVINGGSYDGLSGTST